MQITIEPFTIDTNTKYKSPRVSREIADNKPIMYWGIYLNDENISYTSSRELAEKTKEWMEKWLTTKH